MSVLKGPVTALINLQMETLMLTYSLLVTIVTVVNCIVY